MVAPFPGSSELLSSHLIDAILEDSIPKCVQLLAQGASIHQSPSGSPAPYVIALRKKIPRMVLLIFSIVSSIESHPVRLN